MQSGSHIFSHEGGKGAVCVRAVGGLVFAGCYDGCVYVFRDGARRPLAQLRGPHLMLLSLTVLGTKVGHTTHLHSHLTHCYDGCVYVLIDL